MSSPTADVELGQTPSQPAERGTGTNVEVTGSEAELASHRISTWRMPSEPGKLPGYVRAHFRIKVFALIAIQSMVVFGVAALIDFALTTTRERAALPFVAGIGVASLALISLIVLHFVRSVYPMNYAMFVLFTLLVGISWGIGGNMLLTHVHFQLLGIVCIAMFVATSTQALALQAGLDDWKAVVFPILLGWVVGSIAVSIAGARLGGALMWSAVAEGVSLVQFAWLMLDMNSPLQQCNPDDFMKVVISMDSTLFVIVSIPLWIIGTCCVHAETSFERERAAQADAA